MGVAVSAVTLPLGYLLGPMLGWNAVFLGLIPALVLATTFAGRCAGWANALPATLFVVWASWSDTWKSPTDELTLAGFAVAAVTSILIVDSRHRALRRAEAAQAELERAKASLEDRISERTARLTEMVSQMEMFSYSVSHDLRSPVRSIAGFAQVLRADHGPNLCPEARQLVDRIIRGGERMSRLIDDLLAYSRVNRSDVLPATLCLDELVRVVIRETLELQPPRAEVEIAHPLPAVRGTEILITLALSNLLGNAAKFVRPGTKPRVRIRAESHGEWVRLWIEDNGIGIAPQQQGRLFGLFERLHPPGQYEGTGLGLAIVQRAVERMEGSVGLESDGHTGSRFWVMLPKA